MNRTFIQKETNQPSSLSAAHVGKTRRLATLFSPETGKTIILPLDDSLIFGPKAGLERVRHKLPNLLHDPPNALLAFLGLFRANNDLLSQVPAIVNLTASTALSYHTHKVLVTTIEQALQIGADAVAVHVNVTSEFEAEMLRILGSTVRECESYGMPLLAIMYPRGESASGDNNYEPLKKKSPRKYAELVAHAARVAADLGADIIKTKYTGTPDSFRTVVEACEPAPIVIAGGPAVPMAEMLRNAYGAVSAGAAGVSFGRNIFTRADPQPFITALKGVVHHGLTPAQALRLPPIGQPTTTNY